MLGGFGGVGGGGVLVDVGVLILGGGLDDGTKFLRRQRVGLPLLALLLQVKVEVAEGNIAETNYVVATARCNRRARNVLWH